MIRKLLAVSLFFVPLSVRAADVVVADFEGTDYTGWTVTGTAFGKAPAQGTLPDQQSVTGFQGKGLANSYNGGDKARGKMVSKPFTISNDNISFLIGGGSAAGKTCINLRVDSKIVATATGQDDERLEWYTWDVKAFRGQQGTIEIVDAETGGWGHINVDQIIQTDTPPVPPTKPAELYQEAYRPQFHFSASKNWINDPNGCVYYGGEYHLFFQFNPRGNQWGNMTWGHATSPDLMHWTQIADALEPDKLGTMFSGSAVVDWNNTSGFGKGAEKPLIAMYTAAGGTNRESKGQKFSQCIAYSNDKGRTWTKYDQNPVIPFIAGENRDPKLIWYEPDHKWIVAIYKDASTFALFSSPDLKAWTHLQDLDLPGCSECPDFFPMQLDADPAKTKWVFTMAIGKYVVGDFDGKQFTPDQELRQVDFGRNYYAVQSFSDIPKSDGRRIQIAWMRDGRYPRMPFNGQMSFPSEMTLRTTSDGPRLFRKPIREIEALHGAATELHDVKLEPGTNPLADIKGDLFHVQAQLEVGTATTIGFKIFGEPVTYSVPGRTLTSLGTAPLEVENGLIRLDILVDRTTIETFANDGRVSLTSCFLAKPTEHPLELFVEGGSGKIVSLSVFPLKSTWPAPLEKAAAK